MNATDLITRARKAEGSTAMTEDEMVRALMRDVGLDRGIARRVARDALLRESMMPHLEEGVVRGISIPDPEPSESDLQIALVAALVGDAVAGKPRTPGAGLSATHPELALLYAINPNAGAVSRRNAGRSKAMGLLPDMPDLCLPAARGPFHSCYLELKRPGHRSTISQRRMHEALRAQGHCVIEAQGVAEAAGVFLGYLALPLNRPSARAISGRNAEFFGPLEDRIMMWRETAHQMLTPARGKR